MPKGRHFPGGSVYGLWVRSPLYQTASPGVPEAERTVGTRPRRNGGNRTGASLPTAGVHGCVTGGPGLT